ncbi:GNAT family N-acetyltransferase [Hymenobacter latericus]|uniref:GNAT family N-acetyltransferase n=1 Tax=Hymenobacter sp. YIM 151858-1 TaxID=2987688 RepID=UPI002227DECD|nr:GNAT family N-acetyltransferase [Hymenobacter sp. YIM 151858-1]UYZ58381.1 GNAT family N-acetyltransferase [Hymenobacter sp. YIM 151858-1]
MSVSPSSLPVIQGEVLDFYLSQGYYRMHQDLFTCRFLPIDEGLYTVHWLRLDLGRVSFGTEQRRLLRQNKRFTAVVRPFRLTTEYEELYARYRSTVTFEAPETVEAFLLAGARHNVFTTHVIELRDGERLIAAGIFDSGEQSLAGIMNFYDPTYRKHSLGKYLMLLKIIYALQEEKAYYYPGYVVHNYPKFDYKLYPCPAATEVYDAAARHWLPFSWDIVAAQSAELLKDWPPKFGEEGEAE